MQLGQNVLTLKKEFESNMQATSMEVNGPDIDVLESPACAEL